MMRDGIVDLVLHQSGLSAGPFSDRVGWRTAVPDRRCQGGIRAIDKWYRKYAATEMKDVKYCFGFVLDPVRLHSRTKRIVVPGDIKGLKLRPSQATFAAWVTLLGGTNVQSGPSEMADLMSKGVVDAVTSPWGSVTLLGIDKVTKYHLDIPLATATFQWIMNPKTYDVHVGERRRK